MGSRHRNLLRLPQQLPSVLVVPQLRVYSVVQGANIPGVGIDEGRVVARQPHMLLDLSDGAWPPETPPTRLGDLRLLALEPGSRSVERQRHHFSRGTSAGP